jgi:hypothetical protein
MMACSALSLVTVLVRVDSPPRWNESHVPGRERPAEDHGDAATAAPDDKPGNVRFE